MTQAHTDTQTLRLQYSYPDHEPRESDPHYHLFTEAKHRLKRLGKLVCWIGNANCSGQIELHHDKVEFALANDIDIQKFIEDYPEFGIRTDDEFLAFVESEGNLLPLCTMHHRGILGIHTIHYPAWVVQRVMKTGIAPPEKKV